MESTKKPDAAINDFYTIITGIFKYDWEDINKPDLNNCFANWKHRINAGQYENTFDHLNKNYYDSYITNMFPEIREKGRAQSEFLPSQLSHLTLKEVFENPYTWSLSKNEKAINGSIPYIDVFLFPNNIGLFSIKFEIDSSAGLSLDDISGFIKTIRKPTTEIKIRDQIQPLKEFIEKNVLKSLSIIDNWNDYNPLFKTYSIIDLTKKEFDDESFDQLLFDLGNVSSLGTAAGDGSFAPSTQYFDEQMRDNKISVFKNWSALCLFDTFTRISQNLPDHFKVWEYDYFNIYIHTLYLKSFMYLTNTELSDVTKATRKTAIIKDKFVEFINDYYLSHISYKFLPNLLFNKMMFALEIHTEIDRMEKKIQRINESFQNKREITLNTALAIIIFLSLFSVITDLSSWLEELGVSHNWIYPYSSIFLLIGILASLVVIMVYRKNR